MNTEYQIHNDMVRLLNLCWVTGICLVKGQSPSSVNWGDFLQRTVPSQEQRFHIVAETAGSQYPCSPSSLEIQL